MKENIELIIQSDISMPQRRYSEKGIYSKLRETFSQMKPGESFLWERNMRMLYNAARQVKIKITVRKQNGTGFRVWRVE